MVIALTKHNNNFSSPIRLPTHGWRNIRHSWAKRFNLGILVAHWSILRLLPRISCCDGKLRRYFRKTRMLLHKKSKLEMKLSQFCKRGYSWQLLRSLFWNSRPILYPRQHDVVGCIFLQSNLSDTYWALYLSWAVGGVMFLFRISFSIWSSIRLC